jgi:OOP family OmpA-OmpF porin
MKKGLQLLFLFLFFYSSNAQIAVDTTGVSKKSFNRWSIEASAGHAKGIKPYADGYYSSDPNKTFGGFQLNSFGIGARYMISPKFGIKLDLNFDNIENQTGTSSLDFQMIQYRTSFQGVVNLFSLFDIQENAGRFGLLLHGGFQFAKMTSKTQAPGHNYNRSEINGGYVFGFTPEFRITNSLAFFVDLGLLSNYRQHYNWDGSFSDSPDNLYGQMVTTTFGLSYSFGNGKMHGDWAIIEDKSSKEVAELNKRIGDMETLMNDADKDGVPDYLDVENNSIAGVAVDTKGRMVDKNNNGVPDELEKYIDKSITNSANNINNNNNSAISNNMLEQLISDGYIAAYFDVNKRQPTKGSADNIGFVLNYLRNNPSKSVDIIGYADELGSTDYNNKLSTDRSQNVKNILIEAGIDESRLNIVGNGVDNSVDKNSDYARRLVRKVVFKIK